MLLITTSTADPLLRNVNIDDLEWPLTPKIAGFSEFFCNFGLRHAFQKWIAPKWLKIDQDNLHMKFSSSNADFTSPSPDHLDSRRPAHVDVKEGYPCKKWLFILITSTDDEIFMIVNIDDLEWPWTLKILILSNFLAIFGCKRVNRNEMDGNRPRLPANRNCHRLSRVSRALAQISCCIFNAFRQSLTLLQWVFSWLL